MRTVTVLLAAFVLVGHADNELIYHDGTPQWISWGGMYRGTWFDVEDFIPGSSDFLVEWVDLWFYHASSHPWDTSQVLVELWNGDQGGPVEFLASEEATALGQGVTRVYFEPPVETEPDFWCLLNTELSAGGWPALFVDGTPGEHSYFSDGFIWEPMNLGDYFMSVGNELESSLQGTSWGALKVVFSQQQ